MTVPGETAAGLSGGAGYTGRWQPSSVSAAAASFARTVVAAAGPHSRERAKNLLWAAGKLADYGIGLGLEPVPEVLLHPEPWPRPAAWKCSGWPAPPGSSPSATRSSRSAPR